MVTVAIVLWDEDILQKKHPNKQNHLIIRISTNDNNKRVGERTKPRDNIQRQRKNPKRYTDLTPHFAPTFSFFSSSFFLVVVVFVVVFVVIVEVVVLISSSSSSSKKQFRILVVTVQQPIQIVASYSCMQLVGTYTTAKCLTQGTHDCAVAEWYCTFGAVRQ